MIEYMRRVSNVCITEQGLYHQGKIPNTYDGPYLIVEVVHSIVFASEEGNLMVFTCNPPPAKDENGAVAPYEKSKVREVKATASNGDPTGTNEIHRIPQKLIDEIEARKVIIEKKPGGQSADMKPASLADPTPKPAPP